MKGMMIMPPNEEEKYNWSIDKGYPDKITNNDLTCFDCKYVIENKVGECEKFQRKPALVLYGGNCGLKEKKD